MIDYAGGVRGLVDVRWHSKIKRDECRIRGTDGEIELSPLNGPELRILAESRISSRTQLHYPIIENFVDSAYGSLRCWPAELLHIGPIG